MNKSIKIFIKWALILFKWALILLTLVIVILLILDIFTISQGWSFFFRYFQLHFHWDIWLIRIISLVFVFIFLFFVLPCILKVFNPIKPRSKKILPAFIIVCFFCTLWYITYLGGKGNRFDAEGRSLSNMAWAVDHYEEVESHYKVHPVYGTPVYKVTPENISSFSLKKIKVNDNTVFFSPVDGTPLIYYYNMGSKFEFFNSKGRHPQYGEELLPVTSDIIKKYFEQIENERKKAEEENKRKLDIELNKLVENKNESKEKESNATSTTQSKKSDIIAVLKFNHPIHFYGEPELQGYLITELFSTNKFSLAETSRINEMHIQPSNISLWDIQKLGQTLGVDKIMTGELYIRYLYSPYSAEYTANVRMIDIKNNLIEISITNTVTIQSHSDTEGYQKLAKDITRQILAKYK